MNSTYSPSNISTFAGWMMIVVLVCIRDARAYIDGGSGTSFSTASLSVPTVNATNKSAPMATYTRNPTLSTTEQLQSGGTTSADTSLPEISSVSAAMQSPPIQSVSPMTVLEIESPLEVRPAMEHEYIGTSGPNKRENDGIQRALDWLTEKRSVDYGWGNDTHMVILAKELSGARDLMDSADLHVQIIDDLESLMSVKQMTIDILLLLDQHRHSLTPKAMDAEKLARFILALGSLCKDPKHFLDQHDLLALIQHHEPNDDHTFALTTLAVCSLGERTRKRQIRKLIDIATESNVQNIETMAMVILALRCIMTDHHHRHLAHFVRRPALRLALLQDFTGNFGSLKSTALAMQALQDLDVIPVASWSRGAASKWILDRQREDGGWTEEPLTDGQDPTVGIGLTANIILALGRKGLGAVRLLQCNHVLSETNGHRYETTEQKLASPVVITPSGPTESQPVIETVSYTYTIWFSTQPTATEAVSLALTSPRNTTFYSAMVQASDIDNRFAFEAHDWPNGHYIHTLGGRQEEPSKFNYWLLYRLTETPDPNNPPGNECIKSLGVDEFMVENNLHYLYWFKRL